MPNPEIQFRDYIIEQELSVGAGGTLFRMFSASENGGFGRRDLVYKAHDAVANDANALHQLGENLAKNVGMAHAGMLSHIACSANPGEVFLASEWVPGVTLAALIRSISAKQRACPVPVALHFAAEIAKLLGFLQAAVDSLTGSPRIIVHGQLRPENVFITFGGQVKVLGLAMAELETFALRGEGGFRKGVANYAAPEVVSGRELDGRSDLFSLGALLWELISGRALFPACSREENVRILSEKNPPPPSQTRADTPAELDAVMAKLLDRDLHLRYELAETATQDITAVLKFRYPEFKAADFTTFCRENLAAALEEYKTSVDRASNSNEATKIIENSPPARMAGSPIAVPVAAAVQAQATPLDTSTEKVNVALLKWAPQQPATSEEAHPIDGFFTSGPIKAALAAFLLVLFSLPFAVPRVLHHTKGQRDLARQKAMKAMEKSAILVFKTQETDFSIKVNGAEATLSQGTITVTANQELNVVVEKPGYEEIQVTTQLMPNEEFTIPLEFKKLASQY
jgi:serine/threonine protein kinase